MTWDAVEDILFYGSKEEIEGVTCPECEGSLECQYFSEMNGTKIKCLQCGVVNLGHECEAVPNFAKE